MPRMVRSLLFSLPTPPQAGQTGQAGQAGATDAAADTKPFPTDGSYRYLLQMAKADGFQESVIVYDKQVKWSRASSHDTWKRMCEQNYV